MIALKRGYPPRFVEVKSTTRSAFAGFPPADRRELIEAAHIAGASAFLAWWPPRKPLKIIPAGEWPL